MSDPHGSFLVDPEGTARYCWSTEPDPLTGKYSVWFEVVVGGGVRRGRNRKRWSAAEAMELARRLATRGP